MALKKQYNLVVLNIQGFTRSQCCGFTSASVAVDTSGCYLAASVSTCHMQSTPAWVKLGKVFGMHVSPLVSYLPMHGLQVILPLEVPEVIAET